MNHYDWLKATYEVLACDDSSRSILFRACGNVCCEINGQPFAVKSVEDFWEYVEFFAGDDLAQ